MAIEDEEIAFLCKKNLQKQGLVNVQQESLRAALFKENKSAEKLFRIKQNVEIGLQKL